MNKLLLAVLVWAPLGLFAQDKQYTVTGILPAGQPQAKVFLTWSSSKKAMTDSAEVKNNRFSFTGKIGRPTLATLTMVKSGETYDRYHPADKLTIVIGEGETVKLKIRDSISTAMISASPLNAKYAEYQAMVKIPQQNIAAAQAAYLADSLTPAADRMRAFMAIFRTRVQEKEAQGAKFIKNNPDNYISLIVLEESMGFVVEASKYDPLFNILSGRLRNSTGGVEIKQKLDNARPIQLGAIAPDFELKTPEDKLVKLSDYRGKYVLIDFWASWCGPCRAENPNVLSAYKEHATQNFEVLGVSMDVNSQRDAWIKAIKDDGMPWTQVLGLGMGGPISKMYNVYAIPQNFLLDPSGKIVAKNLRGQALHDKLNEILNNL